MKEDRKLALPAVYEPLLLNCELLFSLAEELGINDDDRTNINEILHENGTSTSRLSGILENAIEATERKDFVLKNTESIRRALSVFTKRLDSLFKDIYTPTLTKALKNIADTISRQTTDLSHATRQFLGENEYEKDEIDEF